MRDSGECRTLYVKACGLACVVFGAGISLELGGCGQGEEPGGVPACCRQLKGHVGHGVGSQSVDCAAHYLAVAVAEHNLEAVGLLRAVVGHGHVCCGCLSGVDALLRKDHVLHGNVFADTLVDGDGVDVDGRACVNGVGAEGYLHVVGVGSQRDGVSAPSGRAVVVWYGCGLYPSLVCVVEVDVKREILLLGLETVGHEEGELRL